MKKILCLLLCITMLVAVFASCQKDATENSLDGAGQANESTTPTETDVPEDVDEEKEESEEPEEQSSDAAEEQPEEEKLPDIPSVLYYTDYTDRVSRTGQSNELCTIDPGCFEVTEKKDDDGNVTDEYVSYTTDSWYIDVAISDAIDLLMDKFELEKKSEAVEMLCTDGLSVYLAIDPEAQNIVEEYFEDSSNFTVASGVEQPEASMVITDPATGDIIALVGGRGAKGYDEYNFATEMTRQPGSSIKPLSVYGPSIESGIISYGYIEDDSPYTGTWPANYPAGYRGATQIHDAICRSVNTIAVKTLMRYGAGKSITFLRSIGVDSLVSYSENNALNDQNAASLGLGGMVYGITNRDLTSGYQIYANKGQFCDSRTVVSISDRDGNVIVDNKGEAKAVVSEATASIMTVMMEEVVDSGTADDITLNDKIAVAGKTGTTDNMNDKWFVGYTPYYIGGVWFGYSTPKNLDAFLKDQSPATKIWQDVMAELHEAKVFTDPNYQKEFEYSSDMVEASVCRTSGNLAGEGCTNVEHHSYFNKALLPTETCGGH